MSRRGPDGGDLPPGPALDPTGRIVGREGADASTPEDESAHDPLTSGPALDASGRIVGRAGPKPPTADDETARGELPSGPALEAGPAGAKPRAPSQLEIEPLAGSIEGSHEGPPAFHGEEPLELQRRPPKKAQAPVHFGAPVRPRKFGRLIGCLGVLIALAAVLLLAIWLIGRTSAAPGPLIILSDPSGAEVIIDGVRVGQTPFATDNLYRIDAVPLELRHPGYLTWHGSFRGRVKQRIKVKMLRAPTPPPVPARP